MLLVLKEQLARMDLASVVGRSQPRLRRASLSVKHARARLKAQRATVDQLALDTPKEASYALCSYCLRTPTAMPMRRRCWRAVWCGDWWWRWKKEGWCAVVVRVVVVVGVMEPGGGAEAHVGGWVADAADEGGMEAR